MSEFKAILDQIIQEKRPCFFFSPHLDDAVLSCGSVLSYVSGKTNVTVATVFTNASERPYTFSAKRFLSKCGETDADTLFEKRRKEDEDVLTALGVRFTHCGEVDGTWRKKRKIGNVRKVVGRVVPEVLFRYPTFLHVVSGKLSKDDHLFIGELERAIRKKMPENAVLFAPLAIGNHVDHVLVRELFSRFPGTIFWSDFPYNLKSKPDTNFIKIKTLKEYTIKTNIQKKEAINGYVTQTSALFSSGVIPKKDEIYYLSALKF